MKKYDASAKLFETIFANRRVDSALKLADNLRTDPAKLERHAMQRCQVCHYSGPFLAGQAFTKSKCKCCGVEMMFSSTAVDKLCVQCAVANEACVKCGADIDLRM